MTRLARPLRRAVLCGLQIILTATLVAQDPGTVEPRRPIGTGNEQASGITLNQAQSALAAVESDTQLDDAVKSLLRPKYQRAIEDLLESARLQAEAARYSESLETAPKQTAALREELSSSNAAAAPQEEFESDSPEELQRQLDFRRIELGKLREEAAQKTIELTLANQRPVAISSRIPEIERTLTEIRRQLSSAELGPNVKSPARVAERAVLLAQQTRLTSERETLEQELASLTPREELMQAELDVLQQQLTRTSSTVDAWNELLYERLRSHADAFLVRAEGLAAELPESDTGASEILVEVRELAAVYLDVIRHQEWVETAESDLLERLRSLELEYSKVQEQRDLSGTGVSTVQGIHNLQRRALLVRVEVDPVELPPLDALRLASIQIRDKLQQQVDLESELPETPADSVGQLITTRRELLETLQRQYARQLRSVADLHRYRQRYQDRAEEIRSEISEQLIGFQIRSCPPITMQSLAELPEGLAWVIRWDHWSEYGHAFLKMLKEQPVVSGSWLLLIAVLVGARRRIQRALVESGSGVGRVSVDRFRLTIQSMSWSILLAAPLPMLLNVAHWAALHGPERSEWLLGLADGLWRAARIASIAALTLAVSQPGGLGAVHFGWDERVVAAVRTAVRRLLAVSLPAFVLTSICALGESGQYYGSVGRFSFLAGQVWAIITIGKLVDAIAGSRDLVQGDLPARRPYAWRRIGIRLLQICLIALSIVACRGYLLTAMQLTQGLVWTAARVFGGFVLYCLALRWFMIKQRRLLLAEAMEKRRARQEDQNEQQDPTGEIVSIDAGDQQQGMDLTEVSDHLRNLLQLLFSVVVAFAVVVFWTRIYPLIDVLDSIPVPPGESLTLLGLLTAGVLTAIIVNLVHILPGLLELTWLRNTTLESGTRNAIYTLGQYSVIAVGFFLVAGALNLDWAKISWIAAGLSVGLGFGMQEIVANFVCGLILLFERPIRVGDVVTLEETTGTVTRINIRATTITNWDRQDFVVPNKNLITGTILNWTLTASLNRVSVSVGVAYDSDTDLARKILLDVANDHPRILADPEPIASFNQFSDSSLNLVLFAYLPDLNHRISTISELHTEIKKRFAAAGIEIPYPQRDIHFPNRKAMMPETFPTDPDFST